jgi:hypothetical protein
MLRCAQHLSAAPRVTLSVAKGLSRRAPRCFAEFPLSASEWAQHDKGVVPSSSIMHQPPGQRMAYIIHRLQAMNPINLDNPYHSAYNASVPASNTCRKHSYFEVIATHAATNTNQARRQPGLLTPSSSTNLHALLSPPRLFLHTQPELLSSLLVQSQTIHSPTLLDDSDRVL